MHQNTRYALISSIITFLVCVCAFSIFLLFGVFRDLIITRQNDAIKGFVYTIETNARKTDNKTQLQLDSDTMMYCMVQDAPTE